MNEKTVKRRQIRPILFRLTAVLIGLSPFLFLEAGLRLGGWQPQTSLEEDPFVEFHSVRPLFVPDDSGQRMEISANRLPLFRPDSFAATKGENEFRIFVLGGSTVQGRPYAIETSFTTWLELSLQSAAPDRDWQVVNCGGVSYASYRLVPIMQEISNYEPDLVVLYTGHNEFLEDRSYDHVKRMPTSLARAYVAISSLKSFRFCRQLCGAVSTPPTSGVAKAKLAEEVDALLDYRNGLEDYHRDAAWTQGVVEHFELNLHRMVQLAKDADVPLIMANPACNLKDCPPFKMADSENLNASDRLQSEQLWSTARALKPDQNALAIQHLREAIDINSGHAGLHFHLAKCYLHSGEKAPALSAFTQAKDEDICPLRILSSMQSRIYAVAGATETPIVDCQLLFQQLSEDGITGDRWFLDHVHPTIGGHQKIAARLLDEMVQQGLLSPRPGWEADRDKRYQQHWGTLDVVYFERGKQRLEGLRRWTQGRSRKVKGAGSSPESEDSAP